MTDPRANAGTDPNKGAAPASGRASSIHVFLSFLYIGCTAFGGPIAHRARFRELLVADSPAEREQGRRWRRIRVRPQLFEDLWVFANLLPGPSSSQVAMAIGRLHAGVAGTLAAWLGFTLPPTLLAILGGWLVLQYRQSLPDGLVAGLLLAVLAVIANAIRMMLLDHQRQLRPLLAALAAAGAGAAGPGRLPDAVRRYRRADGRHMTVTLLSCGIILLAMQGHPILASPVQQFGEWLAPGLRPGWSASHLVQFCQVGVILLGLGIGCLGFPAVGGPRPVPSPKPRPAGRAWLRFLWLAPFAALLAAAVLSWTYGASSWIADLAARFYRVGSLVFGGGHVVLPLLEVEMVSTGFVDREVFLIGYGGVQAIPGPLFAFAAFLGAVAVAPESGLPGAWPVALLCVTAIFAPSLLLVSGLLDSFLRHRERPAVRRSLDGANAAVAGILAAALAPITAAAAGKWQEAGLWLAAFPPAGLLLFALLAGMPLPTRNPDPAARPPWTWGSSAFGDGRPAVRRLCLPAPLVVVLAAAAGWLFGA